MNEIIRNHRCSQRSATPFRFEQDAESGDIKMSPIDSNCNPRDYIKEITGVCDGDLAAETLCSAAAALSKRVEMRSDKFYCENLVLQSLHNQHPNDIIEARLVSQETVLYEYAMKMIQSAGDEGKPLFQVESLMNLSLKLFRIHNETIETLGRYRRGGEQKVTVQHTVVADKAIVNNFTGVGVPPKIEETPHVRQTVRSKNKNQ